MIQDKIFFDEKDPTGLSYNTPFTFYGSYQGRLWSKAPGGEIKYYTQNSDLSVYATTGSNSFDGNQTVTGSLTVTEGITGTATTSSYVEYTNVANKPALISGSAQIADFGIFATTGSNGFNGSQSITGSLTVTGQVVAQTLNVQQVTSSIVYSSGSNIFGNSVSNVQQFTGSLQVSGSSHYVLGNVGIGEISPATPLHITTTGLPAVRLTLGSEARVHNISGVNNGRDLNISPFRHFSVQTGNGIAEGIITLNAYEDFVVGTGASYTSRLTISGSGAATFNLGSGEMRLNRTGTSEYLKLNTYYLLTDGNDQLLGSVTGATNIYAGSGASPKVTIASTGAATFSSSVTANGAKPQLYVIGDSGNGAGIFLNTLLSGTNRRNWAIFTEENIDGDFAIKCSTAAGGSPAAGDTRLQITREGNVSIGTTSPGGVFTAQQSNANSLTNVTFDNSATLPASAGTQGTILRFRSRIDDSAIRTTGAIASYAMKTTGAGANNNGDLRFYTGQEGDTNERMRITSGGYLKASNTGVYYGSTTTYHELRNTINDHEVALLTHTGTSPYGMSVYYTNTAPNNTSNWFLYCFDTAAQRMSVRSNGGIYNYQANDGNLSDERTKKDIIPLESYWDKFKAIEIVKFKYKDQTHDDYNIGVIAQQVEAVAPEFVDVDGWDNKPELDEEGNEIVSEEEPLKSIYTADLNHATIKVLQEAMAKIEILEAKIQTLEQQ